MKIQKIVGAFLIALIWSGCATVAGAQAFNDGNRVVTAFKDTVMVSGCSNPAFDSPTTVTAFPASEILYPPFWPVTGLPFSNWGDSLVFSPAFQAGVRNLMNGQAQSLPPISATFQKGSRFPVADTESYTISASGSAVTEQYAVSVQYTFSDGNFQYNFIENTIFSSSYDLKTGIQVYSYNDSNNVSGPGVAIALSGCFNSDIETEVGTGTAYWLGTRPAAPTITITLTPNSALPSLVFPGDVFQENVVTATATVKDSNGPVSGFGLAFTAKAVDQQQSGHNHTNPPDSDLGSFLDGNGNLAASGSCGTDGKGTCSVRFSVSEVSGVYAITASSANSSSPASPDSANLTVQVSGLRSLPLTGGPSPYLLTGSTGNTTTKACPGAPITHPANHYGSEFLTSGIEGFAADYLNETGNALKINDMSLVWGGLLDICSNWAAPHILHRDGESVDIDRTTVDGSGQINPTNRNRLDFFAGTWGLTRLCEGNCLGGVCVGGPLHYQSLYY